MSEDGDDGFNIPKERADYSHLSIGDMLTRVQRLHIENMLSLLEAGDVNAQVMAQINRYLADNGILVPPSEQPKVIEGHVEQPLALPDFNGERYDE